jgi:hypothetical protein
VALAVVGALAPWDMTTSAQAGSKSRQTAKMRFTTTKPDHSTGLRIRIDYVNPQDRDAKPFAVRQLVERLARGARIDTSVPELCTASDAELMAEGQSACPSGSRVGTGLITFDTGFPEPARFVEVDIVFLNNTDELIFLSTPRGTGARVVARAPVGRRTFRPSAPTLPGTPPDGAAIDTVEAELEAIEDGRRSYMTTPRECPADDRWINKIRFTYADGVSQKVKTANRCG